MITDIPGYSWGLVPVMAQCGIRYFSIGTNAFHRIGDILQVWGDKPFYWSSASGNEKVLCWVHGKGYSEFHTGLAYTQLTNKLKEQLIFDYINELDKGNYPYDIITMRYNIGSDNGPPDPYLSDIVKAWNEKYVSPKLVISTVSESFAVFEKKYGASLPVVSGDFNGYWEDGAASSAKETAITRQSTERLIQAETMHAMLDLKEYPNNDFHAAWQNILLFNEHTWGSWNSISEPYSDFTKQQWKIKQSFALKAKEQTDSIMATILTKSTVNPVIDIYNTNSWMRTDLVILPLSFNMSDQLIKDESGKVVLSQKLSTGETAFLATGVPGFGSKRYFISPAEKVPASQIKAQKPFVIENDYARISIDSVSGSISELKFSGFPFNFVNVEKFKGLNDYYYVEGRLPNHPQTSILTLMKIKENGPLVVSFIAESDAPGCKELTCEVRLVNGLERVEIINTLDKLEIIEPEGVHFAFPFHIPNGQTHISTQWNYYNPAEELLPGSNKNFFSVNRWADISNEQSGITWISADAPLIELDQITMDEIEYGWVKEVPETQTFVSYPMNNYWETNYKASQEGSMSFRYYLFPHKTFDAVQSEKWGVECHQPLIPVLADQSSPAIKPTFVIDNPSLLLSSMKILESGGVLLYIYNPGSIEQRFHLKWPEKYAGIYLSDPFGNIKEKLGVEINIAARDVKTILLK
jgi:alpha-mannosidase